MRVDLDLENYVFKFGRVGLDEYSRFHISLAAFTIFVNYSNLLSLLAIKKVEIE